MRPEVVDLFYQLAELSTEEQARYLADQNLDSETVREVEELLAHDRDSTDPLPRWIAAAAWREIQRLDSTGARCGAFRLVRVIGRGGMGVVYFAERVDGEVRQDAAIKLLSPGWTEANRERFLQEREILAGLAHPNIARLLDAGHLEDGQPYLTMEYVDGEPIDRYCAGKPAAEKLRLFLKVCGAVEYLHGRGLVHRDLKPSNILVAADGEPKLLDFGISKILDLAGDLTTTASRMLTPKYASPEQAAGRPVTTATDIYSLGAVLHELLTAGAPQGPSSTPAEWRGDLDLILRAALRPEAEARYRSVADFAADVRAVLESGRVRARNAYWRDRAQEWFGRRPVAAVLSAAAALAVGAAVWSRPGGAPAISPAPERLTANTVELPVQAAAISPDGKWIAYSDAIGIHLRGAAGGDTRVLPETAGHVLTGWTPDSESVRSTVQDGPTLQAMRVSLSGGAPTPAPAPDSWVASPDGKRRATFSAGAQRLIVQDTAGGDPHEIWRADPGLTFDDFIWAPNAREVAIVSSGGDGSTLELVDVDSGRKAVLVGEAGKLTIGAAVWLGPNRLILSTVERVHANSYNSNLWEVRLNVLRTLDTGGLRKLTAWTDFPIQPGSLTTDGKRVVFVRNFSQRDVYVAGIDAARSHLDAPRRLTLDLGDDYPTAWTRDSKSVILTSDRGGVSKIFRQDLRKPEATPIVDLAGTQILPRMTPDGESVLFCSIVPVTRECRIMRTPVAGGAPQFVGAIPQIGDFRCSRAGPCTVAERRGAKPGYDVYELDWKQGKGREIYRDPDGSFGTPDVSPDGRWLAAVSRSKIIIRSFATGAIAREIPVRGVTQLATLDYAPDGKGFYAGEFLPHESRQFYVDLAGRATLLWRQPGKSLIWSIPSPDGRKVAMLLYTTDSNVYMVDGI